MKNIGIDKEPSPLLLSLGSFLWFSLTYFSPFCLRSFFSRTYFLFFILFSRLILLRWLMQGTHLGTLLKKVIIIIITVRYKEKKRWALDDFGGERRFMAPLSACGGGSTIVLFPTHAKWEGRGESRDVMTRPEWMTDPIALPPLPFFFTLEA